MQNSVLHQVSSQLYNSGYGDNVPDLPMQMDNRLNSNDSSFYLDSSIYSPQDQDQIDGVFAICSQVPLNYQYSGMNQPSFGATQHTTKSNMQLQTNYDRKNLLELSQIESLTGRMNQYDIRNTRKRPVENGSEYFQQKSHEDTVNNKSLKTGWPSNKKMSLCFQGQYSHDQYITGDIKEIQKFDKVPARRSQKLADRITALQKLVSPYGKTDTASVLHEASMFIKALLDQIQNMLNDDNLTSNNENSNQGNDDKQFNLQDKGLCLVPISKTQKLVKEETTYHYSTTMINSPISPDNFSTLL